MKANKVIGVMAVALPILTSMNAWSQGGAAGAPASEQDLSTPATSGAAAPTARQADRALRRKVYAAIGKHKEISAGDISVRAKDGAVTLSGTVTDADQIGKVEGIAKGVPGVTSVTNKLTVKKPLGGM